MENMGILNNRVQVFEGRDLTIGEFDPSADGFYRNVMTYRFDVKKNRTLYVDVRSDVSVDIAVANENGSSIAHKQAVKEDSMGPIPTGNNREMGLFVGVYPGDKAVVDVDIWMER